MSEAMRLIEEDKQRLMENIETAEFDYDYPNRIDWRPKSEHAKLIAGWILDKGRAGARSVDDVAEHWRQMEMCMTSFVPLDAAESKRKAKDWRKPVHVVVPMTFAARETFLTYAHSVFLRTPPIYRFRGRGSKENRLKAALGERALMVQNLWFQEALRLDCLWSDGFTYGTGWAAPTWTKHKARKPVDTEVTSLIASAVKDLNLDVRTGDIIRTLEERTVFEGNKLKNLDPWNVIKDPKKPSIDYQDSEFFGWTFRTDIYSLLSMEADPENHLFNCQYVEIMAKNGKANSILYRTNDSGRNESYDDSSHETHDVDVTVLYVRVSPRSWGLADSSYPELWEFWLAGDQVIIKADKVPYDHGRIPVVQCTPNPDAHRKQAVSHLETTFGLQLAMDWLIHSMVDEAMMNINGTTFIDQGFFEMGDMLKGGPKIVRVRRREFGNGNLADHVFRMPATSSTANNIPNALNLLELFRQGNGTTDITMGNMSSLPERPTQMGVQMATSALSRLQRVMTLIAVQTQWELAFQELSNTVQFMQEDICVPAQIGRYDSEIIKQYGGEPSLTIGPWDLNAEFDVEIGNGAPPQTENLEPLKELAQVLMQNEMVQLEFNEKYDAGKIVEHIARVAGCDSFQDFLREGGTAEVSVVPDQQAMEMAQTGNYAPVGEIQ